MRPATVRATGWPTMMQLLVFATVLTLMVATTHYFVGDPVVSAARWMMYSLVCVAFLFRPRNGVTLRAPRLFDAAAAGLIMLAAASVLYSSDPSLTMQRTISFALMYIAVFWTMWAYADFVGDLKVANVVLQVACLVFLAGVVNFLLTENGMIASRYRGVMENPNAIGMLTIVILPLAIAKWVRDRTIWMMFITLLIVASVTLSGSRNGVVAAAAGIVFMLFRVRAWKSAIMIATLGTALYLSIPESPVNVGRAAESLSRLMPGEHLALAGGRVEAWQVALPIIGQKLVLGHGFGTEEAIFKGMRFMIHRGQYVHNSYLGFTYQLGLAGALLLFTPLVWMLFRRGFATKRPSIQTAAYEAILFGGLIACLFESWIYSAGNGFAFPFWVSIMLLTRIVLGAPETPDIPARVRARAAVLQSAPVRAAAHFGPQNVLASGSRTAVQRFDPPITKGQT